jgi:hypothetical protein
MPSGLAVARRSTLATTEMKPDLSNVVRMTCPVCERRARRQPGDRLTMHSFQELAACTALKEGVSIEEIQRRWAERDRYQDANRDAPEMVIEGLVFNYKPAANIATIRLDCDLGALVFWTYIDVEDASLPVPPVGTKIPNTFFLGESTQTWTFEERRLYRERTREQNRVIQAFRKPLAEVRFMHLPPMFET